MLLSPLKYINPISGNRGGGGISFSIANSFYLDGVSKNFNFDNFFTPLSTTSVGVLSVTVKATTLAPASSEALLSFGDTNALNDFWLYQTTAGKIEMFVRSGGIQWRLETDNAVLSTTDFVTIDVVQDGVSPVIYIDGVAVAQTFTNSTDKTYWFDDAALLDNGRIGCKNFNNGGDANFFNGYVNQVSLFDISLSQAQITAKYNNGKPKDPIALHGANCIGFWDASQSGDTAQFTVTDSVNSLTSLSANLVDADKTPLTAYYDLMQNFVNKFTNIKNWWCAEKSTINGTTTTMIDYKAEHDLANPAVANQPLFAGAVSGIANRPTLYFNLDDYVSKNVAYRTSDATGVITFVSKKPTGNNNSAEFSVANSAALANNIFPQIRNTNKHSIVIRTGVIEQPRADTTIVVDNFQIVSFWDDGTTTKAMINGVLQTMDSASSNWLSSLVGANRLSIGAALRSSILYGADVEIYCSGYSAYNDVQEITDMHTDLLTIKT